VSRLHDRKKRHDVYYRRAKKEQYASRAVYKLQEIDRRFRLFKKGHRVLDLGCWPGSWMQYTAKKVGPSGRVVGLDRKQVTIALPPNTETLLGNVFELEPETLRARLAGSCNVVLSDMAPDTSGVRLTDVARSHTLFLRVLEVARHTLAPNGHLVAKVFQGSGFEEVLAEAKTMFGKIKNIHPKGSRKTSIELYVVAMRFKPQKNGPERDAQCDPRSDKRLTNSD
jgi:23S rRNA (uridine2552-2'-O)-methyltransferase